MNDCLTSSTCFSHKTIAVENHLELPCSKSYKMWTICKKATESTQGATELNQVKNILIKVLRTLYELQSKDTCLILQKTNSLRSSSFTITILII